MQINRIYNIQNNEISRNKKIAKMRRQRGYNWEDLLVKRFNAVINWKAVRLGSPSISLPDIIAINNTQKILYVIEAKSGTGTTLHVPLDQIKRCFNWANNFKLYKSQIIFAFKFSSKKRIRTNEYEKRKLKEYYKVCTKNNILNCTCTYTGNVYSITKNTRINLDLLEFKMPFYK